MKNSKSRFQGVVVGLIIGILISVSTFTFAADITGKMWRIGISLNGDTSAGACDAVFLGSDIYVPIDYFMKVFGLEGQYNSKNGMLTLRSTSNLGTGGSKQTLSNETVTFSNGDKYTGMIVNNAKHGYGVYEWASGDKYYGQWSNDERTGHGIYYFSNGDIYTGEFRNGDMHGYGVYITSDNNVFKGEWVENKLKTETTSNSSKDTSITLSSSENSKYEIKYPMYLYSDETKRVFIGKLTTNKYDSESIYNEYGLYGSKYSTTSIWNEYGTYGSKYSLYSAFNQYTIHPPLIIDSDGVIVGRLTVNRFITGAVNPNDLYQFLKHLGQ